MRSERKLFKRHLPVLIVAFLMTGRVSLLGESGEPPPALGPVVDQDPAFITPPAEIASRGGFVVAEKPPRITFSSVRGLEARSAETGGVWTNFGEGICASTGKFYVAFGNNAGVDGNCCLYEYDPATHKHRCVLDMAELLGQKPGEFGHGKLHGRLDEMPDGWIYMATCCNLDSQRLSPELRLRLGSRLARYHTRTGRAEDLGIPVPGETYPMNGTDTRRGIFHGIGLLGGYIAYDLHTRRPLYQGKLPGDIRWSDRGTLIDPKTGCCYGSDPDTRHIVKYDPCANRFCRTKATIPESPITGREAHPGIRTYTRRRLRDGSFVAQTSGGVMFKFFPDEQRTELIGLNWGDGCYCTAMALSRDGRYLYYTVGLHNQVLKSGPPIIQFDTQTRQKKVLAFLHPYYRKKYGYVFGTSYSICLDHKDANLLITWSGHFPGSGNDEEWSGHPAFMYVEIPGGGNADPDSGAQVPLSYDLHVSADTERTSPPAVAGNAPIRTFVLNRAEYKWGRH